MRVSQLNLHYLKAHRLWNKQFQHARICKAHKYSAKTVVNGQLKCTIIKVKGHYSQAASPGRSNPANSHHTLKRTKIKRPKVVNTRLRDVKSKRETKNHSSKPSQYNAVLKAMPEVRVELVDCVMPKLEKQDKKGQSPVAKLKSPRNCESPRQSHILDSVVNYRAHNVESGNNSPNLKLKLSPERSPSPRTLYKPLSSPRTPDCGVSPGIKLKLKLNYKPCECQMGPNTNCICGRLNSDTPFTASIIQPNAQLPPVLHSAINSDEEDLTSHTEQNNNESALSHNLSRKDDDLIKTEEEEEDSDEVEEEGDMPDDLSRHSPDEQLKVPTEPELVDCSSLDYEGPPSLTRIPSEDLDPPMLPKVSCTGSNKCHHHLGQLSMAVECPCSPKVTGISPQYTVREEATSVGHGSPPSDVEPQFLIENGKTVTSQVSPHPQSVTPTKHAPTTKSASSPRGFFDAFASFLQQKQEERMDCDEADETEKEDEEEEDVLVLKEQIEEVDKMLKDKLEVKPNTQVMIGELASKTVVSKSDTEPQLKKEEPEGQSEADAKVKVENEEAVVTENDLPEPGTSQERDTAGDDKYNLRRIRRQNHHSHADCDCCVHDGDLMDELRKPRGINVTRLADYLQKVLHLRHSVCELLRVLFPELLYPPHFFKDTHSVEALIDQVVCAVTDQQILYGLPAPPEGASQFDVKVVVCKSPRECLQHLRRKVVYLLKVLLPGLKISHSFDPTSRCVDKLLEEVISRNRVVAK